ncbi:MAG TPA: carbohydrate-binding protein [Tepidisphaeraceae bacterium]|jgi:uncharacterized delta-60 repeat protein|nr:carbohydrate-binding protein [Tepidisphaeraceae bacterium]
MSVRKGKSQPRLRRTFTIESLEARQLLSVAATGPATAVEGQPYVLTLPTEVPNATGVSGFAIDWGDGTTSGAWFGQPAVTHLFADGPATDRITVKANASGGQVPVPVRIGSGEPSAEIDADFAKNVTTFGKAHERVRAYTTDILKGVATDAQDRIVTAGFSAGLRPPSMTDPFIPQGLVLHRFLKDGTPDATFGDGATAGRTIIPLNDSWQPRLDVTNAFVDSQGRIFVVGTSWYRNDQRGVFTARFTSAGTLDTTYGVGGIADIPALTFNPAGLFSYWTRDAAIDGDGRIVVVGMGVNTDRDILALRLTADGALDETFGVAGVATINVNATDQGTAVAIAPDGGIVLAAETATTNSASKPMLVRLNSSGIIDANFGTAGKVHFTASEYASDLVIQPDGKLLFGRTTNPSGNVNDAIFSRFNADGSIDSTFGVSGQRVVNFGASDYLTRLLLRADGRILATGVSPGSSATAGLLVSLNSNGSFDTSFGTNGVAATPGPVGQYLYPTDAVLQSDGSLVTIEGGGTPGYYSFLAKYLPAPLVRISNAAPTGEFVAPTPTVTAGDTTTVYFRSTRDAAGDSAAGFRFSFDFDNDEAFDVTNSTSGTATVPAKYLTTPGDHVVRGRISDKDGAYTDYTVTIKVVAPVNIVATPSSLAVNEGASATFGVKLSSQPASNVDVQISRNHESDIDLFNYTQFVTFTTTNWNTPQNVELRANEDADAANGTAEFSLTGFNLTSTTVTATEVDNDVIVNPPPPETVTLQGEGGTFGGGTGVADDNAGYNGTGYADFGGNGSAAQWTVNRAAAGQATVTFRYANGSTANRPLAIFINGTSAGTLNFGPTGGWTTWGTTSINVALASGANTIRAAATTSAGGANIDQLTVGSVVAPPPPPPPPPSTTVYQAESATLAGGTRGSAEHAGYIGAGFADFAGDGSSAQFTLTRSAAGATSLAFRYANGSTANRPLAVYVNGASAGTLAFGPTGGWTTWGTATLSDVALNSGTNTINLVATTSAGGANVDQLTVAGTTPNPPPPTMTVYQGESAKLGNGTAPSNQNGGFTGTGYADFAGNGSYAEFTVAQSTAGQKSLAFRYANGGTVNRPLSVTVNGVAIGTLSFAPTGGWTTWNVTSILATLQSGTNIIRLTATTTAGGANVDSLTV